MLSLGEPTKINIYRLKRKIIEKLRNQKVIGM
jgi:hypothetical protein